MSTEDATLAGSTPPRTTSMSRPILTPERALDHVAKTYSALAVVLIVPVSLTVFIVVWGVQQLTPIYAGRDQSPLLLATGEGGAGTPPAEKLGNSLLNALVVVAMIAGVTFLMVCLYKLRCMKIIIGWFVISSAMIFFFLCWIWLDLCATRFQIPYDWVTMSFLLWNFGVVGMLSVFYYSHPRMAQGYLVVLSVIMAWMLARLPEWTTWTILLAVAIYDIVAVLCPHGPLQMLLKAAQERDEPIPGFIYDTDASSSALPRGKVGPSPAPPKPAETGIAPAGTRTESREEAPRQAQPEQQSATAESKPSGDKKSAATKITIEMIREATGERRQRLLLRCPAAVLAGDQELQNEQKKAKEKAEQEASDEEEDPWTTTHAPHAFKLGLGDFIFYSLLVARAAMFSYVSWMICYISVMMGLIGTLASLLFLRGKIPALPALPISIFLATIMFFASRYLIVPYLYFLSTTGWAG